MSETRTFTVTGMTCGHCVASVTEEVQEIAGVEAVDVVLETGALTVTASRRRRRRRPRRRRGGRLPARMNSAEHPARIAGFAARPGRRVFAVAVGVGRAVGPVDAAASRRTHDDGGHGRRRHGAAGHGGHDSERPQRHRCPAG